MVKIQTTGNRRLLIVVRAYKKFLNLFYKPIVRRYLQKDRTFHWRGLVLKVSSGVFHPGVFYSSKYLSTFVANLEMANKTFLEIGSGSGLVSLVAAKTGAQVTTIDISKKAIHDTEYNFRKNDLHAEIIQSDLFENLNPRVYDIIVVNPPYYPNEVKSEADYAWNCGIGFEYFNDLFSSIHDYCDKHSQCYMILSQDCNLDRINAIAEKSHFELEQITKKRINFEWNYIFRIKYVNQ